jgi:hypothetical protein
MKKQPITSVVSDEVETSDFAKPRLADAREIKFRYLFTDNHNNWILNEYTLVEIINAKPYDDMSDSPLQKHFRHVGEVQYTGFKDKDGKEIYEGDILSDWTETDEGMMQSFQTVFFEENCGQWAVDYGQFQNRENWCELFNELKNFEYEVVGNIYENPDLLAR